MDWLNIPVESEFRLATLERETAAEIDAVAQNGMTEALANTAKAFASLALRQQVYLKRAMCRIAELEAKDAAAAGLDPYLRWAEELMPPAAH